MGAGLANDYRLTLADDQLLISVPAPVPVARGLRRRRTVAVAAIGATAPWVSGGRTASPETVHATANR